LKVVTRERFYGFMNSALIFLLRAWRKRATLKPIEAPQQQRVKELMPHTISKS